MIMQETKRRGRPKAQDSTMNKELLKAEEQFEAYDKNIKDLTLDRMNKASFEHLEMQMPMSRSDVRNSADIYLKPHRSIPSREKFNEDYRDQYNKSKEYTQFTAENREIIGETIDIWTKPFAGMPAEWWQVPVNKPVWGPKYLRDQIKKARYHRLRSEMSNPMSADGMGQYYGGVVVDTIIPRLDCYDVYKEISVSMR